MGHSRARTAWKTTRSAELDRVFSVHHELTGRGAGRRWEAEHLIGAIVARLVAEFQGYCRDLHDEAVDHVVGCLGVTDPGLLALTRAAYIRGRDLNTGNPTWNALKNDFGRLEMRLQRDMDARFTSTPRLRQVLADLLYTRNAFVHADDVKLMNCRNRQLLWLRQMRLWRGSLNRLVSSIDGAVGAHLKLLTGQNPW
jgi:hypothetical protein